MPNVRVGGDADALDIAVSHRTRHSDAGRVLSLKVHTVIAAPIAVPGPDDLAAHGLYSGPLLLHVRLVVHRLFEHLGAVDGSARIRRPRPDQRRPGIANRGDPQVLPTRLPQRYQQRRPGSRDVYVVPFGGQLELRFRLPHDPTQGVLGATGGEQLGAMAALEEERDGPREPLGWPMPVLAVAVEDAEDLPTDRQHSDAEVVLAKGEGIRALEALAVDRRDAPRPHQGLHLSLRHPRTCAPLPNLVWRLAMAGPQVRRRQRAIDCPTAISAKGEVEVALA
mmetsp:Transcript_42477/g.123468  ORF Transcript_42477/g.123468 Transcript_42477/m.123468 type:complete len:280 (+) Transcript_42477:613-1452(+)